jgi:hypothetical protein
MMRKDLDVHYKELSSQKVLGVQGSGWHEVTDKVNRCLVMIGT